MRMARRAATPSCCRCPTSTSCSRCRQRSPPSPSRTRRWSTVCCSRHRAETMLTIAADPKHLGARIGFTAVLHTWGSALTHPSARAHDRAGRRHLARRASAGFPAGPASSSPCACFRACSGACFWQGCSAAHEPAALTVLRRSLQHSRPERVRRLSHSATPNRMGGLCQSAVRRSRRPCSPICRATPIASPSPTAG